MARTERMIQLGETSETVNVAPVLSANGRYLAFASGLGNLVPNDPTLIGSEGKQSDGVMPLLTVNNIVNNIATASLKQAGNFVF